jgi:hypothetical protein
VHRKWQQSELFTTDGSKASCSQMMHTPMLPLHAWTHMLPSFSFSEQCYTAAKCGMQ